MVIAGRVLIIPKGAWTNLTPYEMLDLVSEGDKAYLARQASVGMRPSEDASMTYWQPFGSSASIATTDTPGLVMPDGVTITVDATGLIVASLNVSDLKDIKLTNLATGDFLKYDGTQSKWVNVALGTAATRNATSSITSGSTDLIESGSVYSLKQTLETALANKANTTDVNNALALKAPKTDLASISLSGTNTTGATINKGTFFYNNGNLSKAKANIANGASITSSNTEVASAGGLNYKVGFINTSSRIAISLTNGSYTATQDMWVIVYGFKSSAEAYGASIYVDNDVICASENNLACPCFFPLMKGQTISFTQYATYNVIFGYAFK